MFKDFKELLSVFHDHGVRYLIVGGYAVGFHAQPRATKDLDIFVAADTANAQALFAALLSFGAPLEGVHMNDFTNKEIFFQMGYPPYRVDILTDILGVDFDTAWEKRIEATLDKHGYKGLYIAADDLIASKKASDRLQDRADVEAIEQTISITSSSHH